MKEFETKILDINVPEIKNQLKEIGAKKIKEFLLKRWVFDIDNDQEEWIRLRDEDGKVMLAHKHIKGDGISEAEEIETEVKDF